MRRAETLAGLAGLHELSQGLLRQSKRAGSPDQGLDLKRQREASDDASLSAGSLSPLPLSSARSLSGISFMAMATDLNLIESPEDPTKVPELQSTPAESETTDLGTSQACSGRIGNGKMAIETQRDDGTDIVMIPSLDSSPKRVNPQSTQESGASTSQIPAPSSAAEGRDGSAASDVSVVPTAASVAVFAGLTARRSDEDVLSAPNLQLLAAFLLGETQPTSSPMGSCSRLLAETAGRGGPLTARWQAVLGAWLQQQADHRTRMLLAPLALCNPASVPFLISMMTPPQLATLPEQARQLLEQVLRYHAATAARDEVAASQKL